MNVRRVTNDFLISTLSKTVKYVLQWWMKKVWPEFCPFRNYLRVQHNISDIFERFSITSCNKKKMKTQETLKKNSGYINVQCVTNDFLIFTLQRLSNMYFSDEWKKSDLNSVPSETIWGCNIISLTSYKGFVSVHATKKWRRRKPPRKIPAIWMKQVVTCALYSAHLFLIGTLRVPKVILPFVDKTICFFMARSQRRSIWPILLGLCLL